MPSSPISVETQSEHKENEEIMDPVLILINLTEKEKLLFDLVNRYTLAQKNRQSLLPWRKLLMGQKFHFQTLSSFLLLTFMGCGGFLA